MRQTKQCAQKPSTATGRRLALASVPLAAALLCVTLSAATARAATVCPVGHDTAGHCADPEGLAVDQSSGDLFVADTENQRIDEFGPHGEFLLAFGWGVRTGAEQLQTCTEATACRRGNRGSGAGAFSQPQSVAVEQSTHDVYVADAFNHRVQKFHLNPVTEEAEFVLMFGGEVDQATHANLCTAASGHICGAGVTGTANGQFSPWPLGGAIQLGSGLIATGPAGLYVADKGRIQEFDSSGNYTGQVTLAAVEQPLALAINSVGDVYVIAGVNELQRITPPASGTYTLTFEGKTTQELNFNATDAEIRNALLNIAVTVSVSGELSVSGERAVAFNPSLGNFFYVNVPQLIPSAGSVTTEIEGAPPALSKLDPTGVHLQSLDASGEPTALAINAADEVYVRDRDASGEATQVLAYDASGAQTDLVPAKEVAVSVFNHRSAGGLGLDQSAGLLYLSEDKVGNEQVVSVPLPPPGPGVEGESTTELLSTRATAHAQVNPKSKVSEFHFQYVEEATCEAEAPGHCFDHAHETAEVPLGGPVDFEARDASQALPGLQPETAYRYRAVATNSKGTVDGPGATFTTYPPALFSLRGPTAVGPTGATLHLDLKPEGLETHYRFQYVTQAHFEAEGFANPSTTPEATVGPAASYVPASAQLTELEPATTYRYRAVIANSASAGDLAGPDSTLEIPPAVCPNQERRQEEDSTALPQCRAYEQVSPTDKRGFPAHEIGSAPSGERILFHSQGVFAGEPTDNGNYLSRRSSAGWVAEGIDPPPALGLSSSGSIALANEDLTEFSTAGIEVGHTEADSGTPERSALFFRAADGAFNQSSPTLQRPEGGAIVTAGPEPFFASADLSRLFLRAQAPLLEADTYPPEPLGRAAGHYRLYEVAGAGTPSATLRLLSVDPAGHVYQGCGNGGSEFGGETYLVTTLRLKSRQQGEAVSRDGSTVFFNAWSPALPENACATENAFQLLARVDGTETVDLSQPSPSQCGSGSAPAEESCRNAPLGSAGFAGASADGKKAFFVSRRQLTDDASEDNGSGTNCNPPAAQHTGCNLYMYDFERPAGERLTAISAGDSSGLGPGVTGFLDTSADGSRVYFVAAGLLSAKRNALGQEAHAGAENVYVYDTETGTTSFVADLCSGVEASGAVHGLAQCPGSGTDEVVPNAEIPYEVTPDGRYLVFSTYAQLTPDDTNEARDVYRYDAASETLIRVSVGHEEQDQNGNGGGQGAIVNSSGGVLDNVNHRVISADGSTVVFYTARPLQEGDTNAKTDAYLWHQGQVDLLSGGHAAIDSGEDATLSASGEDVFFSTAQGLVPTDEDGLGDIYDARVKGGFPLPPSGPPICESPEGCGRHAGPEPPSPPQGSASLQHGIEEPEKPHCRKSFVLKHGKCVKKHSSPHKHKRHHKRAANHNRGGAK